ncbi:MAG: V-type ATP synthase subunit I [Clostridia bacterium]|nr:V-type ATP synthase subunit I [Clostridia bacterium]
MKKVALIAHTDNRSAVLQSLQDIGAVEVVSTQEQELSAVEASGTLPALEKRLGEVREALDVIRNYDESKTGFLTPKPSITIDKLKNMQQSFELEDKAIEQTKQFSDDMNALKTRRHRLRNRVTQLEPYAKFDAPLESVRDNDYTSCLLGTIPTDKMDAYKDIRKKFEQTAYFEEIDQHKDLLALYVVMAKDADEELTGELKFIGFAEAYTKELYGTPADLMFDLNNEYESLGFETEEYEEKAKKFVDDKLTLQAIEDYLLNEIARERCVENLGQTGSAFMLEGWIVADGEPTVKKAILDAAPESYIEFSEPEREDLPPTAISNGSIVTPFEGVTEMYGVPSSKGFDPNKLMSIFYFLIFGMMMADIAYGLILSLGALLVLKLKKPTGTFRKITGVIMICGIATTLWGFFFGNVFAIEGIPSVINPIQDAILMLVLCLGLGVVHILVGLGIGAYMAIRDGRVWDAIFDKGSWIMILVGGIMLAVGMMMGGVLTTIGMIVALMGFAILICTAGRHKKGIFRKMIGGLASVYDITGYVSDILSYSRIFGMGLATTVIAMVFNTIAGLFMGPWWGYIIGIIVMTIGHVFNIGINTLGSFVHTARLQYIEFFSKFYEGGGHAFMPLSVRTKNHRLENPPQ